VTADLRLGRWQDVLADVERCDSLITDPPYSARTAEGYRTGAEIRKNDEIARRRIARGFTLEMFA
jgi:hypothetical protein